MLAILVASPVFACGGFFCDNTEPVEQTGEAIVFAVDDAAGTVTVHVQVAYQGPSESFAWFVPVPAIPTLEITTSQLFSTLDTFTRPVHEVTVILDECESPYDDHSYSSDGGSSSSDTVQDTGSAPLSTVDVVATQSVGPYETVTLDADTTTGLIAWLEANDYDVPAGFDAAIAPYIAQDQYVLALRLAKDQDTGDLAPIAMTYAGSLASIPIQLTSVAAAPDMPLEVYVLGNHRAVPISYLHVVPNPFAYDWFTGTVDWQDTIGRAADEAGGHAFATDYSTATSNLSGRFYAGQYEEALGTLPAETDAAEWWGVVTFLFPPTAELLEVFRRQIAVPAGVDETSFYNCVPCYADQIVAPFDSVAATADLDASVVQPLRDAQALMSRHAHITRLTSSLDAIEMTVDPTFSLNPDMKQEVSRTHRANLTYLCDGNDSWNAPRLFVVQPEGWAASIPSSAELSDMQMTEYEYLSALAAYSALRIEQTSESGDPVVLVDETAWLEDALGEFAPVEDDPGNDPDDAAGVEEGGCGCDQGTTGSGAALAILAVLALRRRQA